MPQPTTTQLGTFAATGAGTPRAGQAGDHTFIASLAGAGAVSATVLIEVSNDLVGWSPLATIVLAGTNAAAGQATATASYAYWRATVLTLSGGSVAVTAATEQVSDAQAFTSLEKSRLLAVLAACERLAAWGGKAQAGQAGMVAVNNGQLVARSLLAGPGIEILYPTGVGGDPVIYTPPGRVLLGSLMGADLASTADQAIQIREYPWYIVRDIVVTNVSATPVAAAGGVYSTTGKGGRVLVGAGQSYTGLTDDSVALSLTMGTIRRLSGPAVYLSLTTPNGSACTADVYVFGDWLMG